MSLLADGDGPDECADAQADLGFRCPHMPEDMFSHGTDQIYCVLKINLWDMLA